MERVTPVAQTCLARNVFQPDQNWETLLNTSRTFQGSGRPFLAKIFLVVDWVGMIKVALNCLLANKCNFYMGGKRKREEKAQPKY